jgi:hypothetical protein
MVGAAGLKADVELCDTTEEGGYQMDSVPRSGPLPSAQRQSSPQATYYARRPVAAAGLGHTISPKKLVESSHQVIRQRRRNRPSSIRWQLGYQCPSGLLTGSRYPPIQRWSGR